ncbi:MAG: peptidylprolyl isomerase [candidate division Zixibacteria bacterium]|nr:peptidylprolyl isomerase [candidate division Zixibacteria bacterium]
MFEMLRKMIFPIIIIVLIFFVGMIVLEWGMGLSGRNQALESNVAGTINGEEVPWQTHSQLLNNLLQNERAQYGEDYEIPDDRTRQLEQQAWDQLVADRLIKQEGARLGIMVSETDVYNYLKYNPPQFLQQEPDLQTNGQFDYQKYLALMVDSRAAGMWANLEPMVREDLKRIKVQQEIVGAAHVTNEEVREAFIDKNEKVTIGIVNATMNQLYGLTTDPDDKELETWFDAHRDKYKVGERVVLDLVRVSKEPSQFDQEAAQARAKEVYDSVTSGSDFAEFARTYSQDPGAATNSGDLGWFARGRMVKEFDSAAFAMREGEISVPIKTSFGWHIIKQLGYREENKQREAHVAHILIKPETSPQTLDAAWQQLDMVRTQASEVGLAEAAKAEGLEMHTTPPTEKEGRIEYVGAGADVLELAFKMNLGDISEVLDLPNYYCVMRLANKFEAGPADLAAVKATVSQDCRMEKLAKICHDTAQFVYDEVGRGSTLEKAAIRFGLTYEKIEPFSRDASVPKLGSDPKVIGKAFSLGTVGTISKPIDYSTGTVVMELLDRQTPDLTVFNEKQDSVYTQLLKTKQQQTYSAWYTALVKSAKVESNVNTLQRRR